MRVCVQVDHMWEQRSGHLWWRTWSAPSEFRILHVLVDDGAYHDTWLTGSSLSDELGDWSKGLFRMSGVICSLSWLDPLESK